MKNIGFILIMLILFSCGSFVQLEEQTSPLSGIYYILEGWDEFMDGNYERADELFSTTLLGEDSLYYSFFMIKRSPNTNIPLPFHSYLFAFWLSLSHYDILIL